MSEHQPDPSGPQWASAWEYQAGAAAQMLRERGELPPPAQPKPKIRRPHPVLVRLLTFLALAFVVGVIYDAAKGKPSPVGPAVMALIAGGLALWLKLRVRKTSAAS